MTTFTNVKGSGTVFIMDGHPVCSWCNEDDVESFCYPVHPSYNKGSKDNITWRIYVKARERGGHSQTIVVPTRCVQAAFKEG